MITFSFVLPLGFLPINCTSELGIPSPFEFLTEPSTSQYFAFFFNSTIAGIS